MNVISFQKHAEQQAYDKVLNSTTKLRCADVPDTSIIDYLCSQGIDIKTSFFPAFKKFDKHVYIGTVISQHRSVFEFWIDTSSTTESEIDDVTNQLGPKDPFHPKSDLRDTITMALFCFDEQSSRYMR